QTTIYYQKTHQGQSADRTPSHTLSQFPLNPFLGQGGVGIRNLNAGGGVALQHSGQYRAAGTGEGVQNTPSLLRDLYHIPHELQGLFCQVDAVLGIAILEYAGQTGDRSADRHIPVGPPDNVLSLLTETALLGTAV